MVNSADIAAQADEAKRKKRQSTGFSSTILASPNAPKQTLG
jgi:hypothetical protein